MSELIVPLRRERDRKFIYSVINDGANLYKGVIPPDCYHDPYMTREELAKEINSGVRFWGFEIDSELLGVMGIQDVGDVSLIRHAYVRSRVQQHGIGSKLLKHLLGLTDKEVLIGTWEAASWAIKFYKKHGFKMVSTQEKDILLRKYWSISDRQIAVSVVLKK